MSTQAQISGWKRGRRVAGASVRRHRRHHRPEDFAVAGVQEVSGELGRAYRRLRRRCKARKLVAAIRHCNAPLINHLLAGTNSKVVCFYKKPGYDCVKICTYSRNGGATVTSDICVRSLYQGCGGYGGYGGAGYGGGVGFY